MGHTKGAVDSKQRKRRCATPAEKARKKAAREERKQEQQLVQEKGNADRVTLMLLSLGTIVRFS